MPAIIFQPSAGASQWLFACQPITVLRATQPADVVPMLAETQRAVQSGLWAAGFLAYEAAAGLDERLVVHGDCPTPLGWFGLFKEMRSWEGDPSGEARMGECERPREPRLGGSLALPGAWQPNVGRDEYGRTIEQIKAYIAAGDTYQVNYSFRFRSGFIGEAWPFFRRLCQAQQAPWQAYIDTGDEVICSASPELFFHLKGGTLTCRPMKGTAPRGSTRDEDERLREALAASEKNRAENAMIVDMMRNDMGRIAQVGSVKVQRAFAIEEYPTVFQMTSTITARTTASLPQIMRALFPCASVTGAPKVRTMEIIRELESTPRGVYTGCIGYASPTGEMRFNVAIRTATVDRQSAMVEYGVGGGIVWDSQPAEEYAECITKAAVLGDVRP